MSAAFPVLRMVMDTDLSLPPNGNQWAWLPGAVWQCIGVIVNN